METCKAVKHEKTPQNELLSLEAFWRNLIKIALIHFPDVQIFITIVIQVSAKPLSSESELRIVAKRKRIIDGPTATDEFIHVSRAFK